MLATTTATHGVWINVANGGQQKRTHTSEKETVVGGEVGWVGEDLDVCGLGWGVHLGENLIRQGLRDPVTEVSLLFRP